MSYAQMALEGKAKGLDDFEVFCYWYIAIAQAGVAYRQRCIKLAANAGYISGSELIEHGLRIKELSCLELHVLRLKHAYQAFKEGSRDLDLSEENLTLIYQEGWMSNGL